MFQQLPMKQRRLEGQGIPTTALRTSAVHDFMTSSLTTSPKIDGVRKMAERSQVGELWLKSSRHIQTWGRQDANGSIEHRHWSDRPDAIYPDAFPDRKIYRTPFLRFAVFLGEILKETWFQSPAGAVEDGDVWAGEESWWRKFPLWSKHIMEVS